MSVVKWISAAIEENDQVMLIDMTTQLKEGDTVPITLSFDDGTKVSITAPVRKLPMTMPMGKAMNHGDMAQ